MPLTVVHWGIDWSENLIGYHGLHLISFHQITSLTFARLKNNLAPICIGHDQRDGLPLASGCLHRTLNLIESLQQPHDCVARLQ